MTVDTETFLSIQKKDFKWPRGVPLTARPTQPPAKTKTKNFYLTTLVEPYCHCDAHTYDPQMGQYKQLAEKEKILHKELDCLNKEMASLAASILDNECDNDDIKMETIYMTDYNKSGLKLRGYRKLNSAIMSHDSIPFDGVKKSLFGGYRDPTSFRYHVIYRPVIDGCEPLNFRQTPECIMRYEKEKTGRSEYQTTYSKMGENLIKSSQQMAEPSPSSRARQGNPCG